MCLKNLRDSTSAFIGGEDQTNMKTVGAPMHL